MSTDMAPREGALVQQDSILSIVSSQFWTARKNGLEFNVDGEGKLQSVPREDLRNLVRGLGNFTFSGEWWLGDTAAAVSDLYGDTELVWFCEQIDKDIVWVKKIMAVSRDFGFPSKINEYRHPDLSPSHHSLVKGVTKDPQQRMGLLNDAARDGMSTAQFYKYTQEWKKGPGAGDGTTEEPEFPVFKIDGKFRVYDPKVDNPEQFVQECKNKADVEIVREFRYYLDPEARAEREFEEMREKAFADLSDEAKAVIIEQFGGLTGKDFKAKVKEIKARADELDSIKKHAEKRVSDIVLRSGYIDKAINENMSLAAFRVFITASKSEIKSREGSAKKVENLAKKIKDEAKRQEVLQLIADEGLAYEQAEGIIKAAVSDELIASETARIQEQAQKSAQKKADRMFAPKPTKASTDSTEGLPLSKSSQKKKGASGTKKSVKKQPSVAV